MASKGCHTQEGEVIWADNDTLRVAFDTKSACGGCSARAKCGMSEASRREVEISRAGNEELKVGDNVTISISTEMGIMSVVIAYIIPLIILIAILAITLEGFAMAEWQGALCSLASVAIYFIGIYIFRDKLDNKITFTINK